MLLMLVKCLPNIYSNSLQKTGVSLGLVKLLKNDGRRKDASFMPDSANLGRNQLRKAERLQLPRSDGVTQRKATSGCWPVISMGRDKNMGLEV